jgi:hypothetical protein
MIEESAFFNIINNSKELLIVLEKEQEMVVLYELGKLILQIDYVSTSDAIPKVEMLIRQLCKTDKPSPEELMYHADRIKTQAYKLRNGDLGNLSKYKYKQDDLIYVIEAAIEISAAAAKFKSKGGRRSKLNIRRRSYNRTNNKSVAKKT